MKSADMRPIGGKRPNVRGWPAWWMLAGVALAGMGCARDKGGGGHAEVPEDQTMPLSFELSPEALNLFSDQPTKLRVRIFTVSDNQTGPQEGGDAVMPIVATETSYKVSDVHMGMKDIVLAVLSQTGTMLGEGKVRYLVKPGAQTLSVPVVIKLVPVQHQRRDLALSLNVQFQTSSAAPPTTYLDTKPMLDAHCTVCHGPQHASGPSGNLDLSAFPFKYVRGATPSQTAIVKNAINQMKTLQMPLPINGVSYQMKPEELAVFQTWVTDGLNGAPPPDNTAELAQKVELSWALEGATDTGKLSLTRADAASPFTGLCKNLVVQGKYDFALSVVAADGTAVYATKIQGFVVDASNTLQQQVTVPYQQPDVTIPVVIEQ